MSVKKSLDPISYSYLLYDYLLIYILVLRVQGDKVCMWRFHITFKLSKVLHLKTSVAPLNLISAATRSNKSICDSISRQSATPCPGPIRLFILFYEHIVGFKWVTQNDRLLIHEGRIWKYKGKLTDDLREFLQRVMALYFNTLFINAITGLLLNLFLLTGIRFWIIVNS